MYRTYTTSFSQGSTLLLLFVSNIFWRKFPSYVSAAVKIADTKRVERRSFARRDLPAHNDRGSSLFLVSILCFFCALLSRYRAVGMRLNRVLTSPFEMQRGNFLPREWERERERRERSSLISPSRRVVLASEDGSKKKSQPRSLPAGTRILGLSARISTARGAPLVPARARKLHDSRNKVLVEFLRNGHK